MVGAGVGRVVQREICNTAREGIQPWLPEMRKAILEAMETPNVAEAVSAKDEQPA